MKTLYELLNVTTNADKEDIKRAFHRLAKQHHPDLSSDSSMFLKILDAYETSKVNDLKAVSQGVKNNRYSSPAESVTTLVMRK